MYDRFISKKTEYVLAYNLGNMARSFYQTAVNGLTTQVDSNKNNVSVDLGRCLLLFELLSLTVVKVALHAYWVLFFSGKIRGGRLLISKYFKLDRTSTRMNSSHLAISYAVI